MSLGVACTKDWQDFNAKQLIKEAVVALYRAKEWGRNRAVLAKPSGLSEIRAMQHPVSAV
jgi:PleD family two-component response regulator